MFNWVNLRRNDGKKKIFTIAFLIVFAGALVLSGTVIAGKDASAHGWDGDRDRHEWDGDRDRHHRDGDRHHRDGDHHHRDGDHHHHKPDLMLAKYHFGDRWYKVGDHVTMHLVVKNRDGAGKAHHDIFVKDWIPAGLSDIKVHADNWHCQIHRRHHHHDHDHDHHHHKSPVMVKCKYTGDRPVHGGEVLSHIKIKGKINHHANKYFVNVAKVETRHDRDDSNNRSVETIKVRKHHHHDHHHDND